MIHIPFLHRPDQSLTEATNDEISSTVHRLIRFSTHDYGYYLFLILSILIATAGILLKSVPIIIGGMIIAPLMIPLLACGLGLLLFEWRGIVHAVSVILFSIFLAIILSACLTTVTVWRFPEVSSIDYIPGIIPAELYVLVAFCSGIAGAYAFVKKHLSSQLPGVAVSASLIPPLAAIGIGVALRDLGIIQGSLHIFLLNIIGIIVAAVLVFWVLGFREAKELEQKVIEEVKGNNG